MASTIQTVTDVLETWRTTIETSDHAASARLFTPDGVFQGLRPTRSIGHTEIERYYAAIPAGTTVTNRIGTIARRAPDVLSAFVESTFEFTDGRTVDLHLTLILIQAADTGWLIDHFHIAPASS
jgi:uncharacterized protein (TIGR02246 family)